LPQRETVSVVIPQWNRRELLIRLLEALSRGTRRPDEVVVVDNASTDGSAEAAESRGATLLRLSRNHGFAYAVNRGVEAAQGRWLAIVNNDVVPAPDWLERITSRAAPFACGKLVDEANPARIDGTFDLVSAAGVAVRAGHGRPAQESIWNQVHTVQLAPLTAAVIRREVFRKIGLLDESFGSYLEDVDFGLRCAANGISGLYVPEAVATHQGSATLGAWSAASVRLLSRNQMLLIAKHYPDPWRSAFLVRAVWGQSLWGLAAIRHGQGRAWMAGKLEGLRAFRNRTSPAPGEMAGVLERCEAELLRVVQAAPAGWLWRLYRWAA
jgi:GT2 family glycosyltransferase